MFCCCVGENILFNIRNYAWHMKESWLAWMHLNSLSWQFVLLMRCYGEWKPFCRLASSAIWHGNESPPSSGPQGLPFPLSRGRDPSLFQKLQLELCWKGLCSPVRAPRGCGVGRKPLWEQNAHTCLLKLLKTEFFQVLKVFYPAFISILRNYISLIIICAMPYFLPSLYCFQLLLSYGRSRFITK